MKINKKIGLLLILILTFLLALSIKVSAASISFEPSPSNTVTVGTEVTLNITGTAASWTLYVEGDGISKTPKIGLPNDSATNKSISESVSFTPTKAGTYTFTLTGTIIDENDELEGTKVNKSITITAKEQPTPTPTQAPTSKPTQTPTKAPTPTPTKNTVEETPDFKSASGKVYTTGEVNLRESWSTQSKATLVSKGTELTLTAKSTKTVNGYVWYRVTYKGQTKYIASNLVSTEKPEEKEDNNYLSSLTIEGVTLDPSFDKDTTNYKATVGKDVDSVEVKAVAESSKSNVKVEGNKNLKDGENTIKITVTGEDGNKKVYLVKVTRKDEDEENPNEVVDNTNLKLSNLSITGVNFENGFNPETLSYDLNLSIYVDKLEIKATPNQKDAKVEIIGNEQFKAGENIVTIMITSADGSQTVTYQIKVLVPEQQEKQSNNDFILYIIGGIILVVGIAVIIAVMSRKGNNDNLDEEDDDEDEDNFEKVSKVKNKKVKEYDEENLEVETEENDEEVEEYNPKKKKGKHSN